MRTKPPMKGRLDRFRPRIADSVKGRYLDAMIWQAADIRALAPSS